jgi:hypothetical protein
MRGVPILEKLEPLPSPKSNLAQVLSAVHRFITSIALPSSIGAVRLIISCPSPPDGSLGCSVSQDSPGVKPGNVEAIRETASPYSLLTASSVPSDRERLMMACFPSSKGSSIASISSTTV